ncbi:MAG: Flp pilus assembly complex ATPase component TadA, partial [Bacteroidales bacterium]|nr:Flp pilus assembly complex ATPase component TadA [Bacteroidales bacterium]
MGTQTKEQQIRLYQKLRRELGVFIVKSLADIDVIEIMVNSSGHIWLDRKKHEKRNDTEDKKEANYEEEKIGLYDTGFTMEPNDLMVALGTIAMMNDKEINEEHPILEAVLPLDGSRVEGLVPPVTPLGPSMTIRKHASDVFSLEQYVKEGRIPQEEADYLISCMKNLKNIVIAGGTSSGKTTFTNAMIKKMLEIVPQDRLIILEDTFEIKCETDNKERLVTTEKIPMESLVRASLRMRPDRIIVGEVRGRESLDLLKSWNTGHPGGIATIHANSANASLTRFENLNMEAANNSS